MTVYLVDHPPRTQQYRCPRRDRPSGVIGVHTAESFADEDGHDSSAEGVAAFIARRTNYGSYHLIVDSDSIIQLVDFGCVAYHIGTHGLNEHTIGISAAVQAHEWNSYGDGYEDAVLRNMARAAARAAKWLEREYGITVPARRISLSEALRGERGLLAHGDADPDRRTDPGSQFKWNRFLTYYAAEMAGELEDDMDLNDTIDLVDEKNKRRWWAGQILDRDEISVQAALGYAAASLVSGKNYAEAEAQRQVKILSELSAIRAAVGGERVDVSALAAELVPVLVDPIVAALADKAGLSQEDVEDAVRTVLGSLDDA